MVLRKQVANVISVRSVGLDTNQSQKNMATYLQEVRSLAVRMYADVLNFRQVGRHLKLSHSTVMDWVKAHAEQLPDVPMPEDIHLEELVNSTPSLRGKTESTS